MKLNSSSHYCVHCWPLQQRNHYSSQLEYRIELFLRPFHWLHQRLNKQPYLRRFGRSCIAVVVKLLERVGIVRFAYSIPAEQYFNRSLIFFIEAQRRCLDILALKVFGKYMNDFRLRYKGKIYFFEGIPLKIHDHAIIDIDDKYAVKQFLEKYHYPVPVGKRFTRASAGMRYGVQLGFPLVVKPNNGSLSCHTTVPVRNEAELREGIRIAQQYRPDYIVEQYIPGELFRITVIGKQKVYACQKIAPHIVGDGIHTIQQLMEQKNAHPNRGETRQKNTTLHYLVLDEYSRAHIASQGYTPSSVPAPQKTVWFSQKRILSQGCDIVNKTQDLHHSTRTLCIDIAKKFNTNLVGFDILCTDISKSYTTQPFAIIEANSLPYIDMHQFPSNGKSERVAAEVWDIVLEQLDNIDKK